MNELSLLDTLFNDGFGLCYTEPKNSLPQVDVLQTKDAYLFQMDLPGMNENQLEISIKDNVLTIATIDDEKKADAEKKTDKNDEIYLLKERRSFQFKRTFTLPRDAESSQTEAKFTNGVLSITIQRKPQTEPKKIVINAA